MNWKAEEPVFVELNGHFGEPVQFNKKWVWQNASLPGVLITHLMNELKSWRTRFCWAERVRQNAPQVNSIGRSGGDCAIAGLRGEQLVPVRAEPVAGSIAGGGTRWFGHHPAEGRAQEAAEQPRALLDP